MSEDIQKEGLNEAVQHAADEQVTEPDHSKLSDVEKQALEKGWKPKDEYQGDPAKWRSAEVFLALEEPLTRIEKQSKEMKQLRAALEAFKEHHTKVKENEYNRALKNAKDAYRKALAEGDTDRALAIDERMDELQEEKQEFVKQAQQTQIEEPQELHPEFVSWKSKNTWYEENLQMRRKADALGNAYAMQGMDPTEVLKQVEQDIRKFFPEKFTNPNRNRPSAVEPSSRGGGTKDTFVPTQQQKEIARKFAASGVMTEAQYYAELKKLEQGA